MGDIDNPLHGDIENEEEEEQVIVPKNLLRRSTRERKPFTWYPLI